MVNDLSDQEMVINDECALVAQSYIHAVLDAEEALTEGQVKEAREVLSNLRQSMLFLLNINSCAKNHKLLMLEPLEAIKH